jgi:hypothetical protein
MEVSIGTVWVLWTASRNVAREEILSMTRGLWKEMNLRPVLISLIVRYETRQVG